MYNVLTKSLLRVGRIQNVSHVSAPEQQKIGIRALGQETREADSGRAAYGVERASNRKNRRSEHVWRKCPPKEAWPEKKELRDI